MDDPTGFCRTIHSDSAGIAALLDGLEEWAAAAGVGAHTARQLGVMLDELLANLHLHAYPVDAAGPIEVRLWRAGDAIWAQLRDQGPPFDPTTLPPADTGADLEDRAIGGLGIHLIRRMADAFSYRRDGPYNETRLLKIAPPRR